MAKQPSTQSKARATSGALEIAKQKVKRTSRGKGKAGTDSGVEDAAKFKDALKAKKTLERKRNKERFKVK